MADDEIRLLDFQDEAELLVEDEGIVPNFARRFPNEFRQVHYLIDWVDRLDNSIRDYEEEVKWFQGILLRLTSLGIFSVPFALLVGLSYFVRASDPNDILHAVHVALLSFGFITSVTIGLPFYVLQLWLVKEDYFRMYNCDCLHHCHMHYGHRNFKFKHVQKINLGAIRNVIMNFLLMIMKRLGARPYLCGFCKERRNNKKGFCHCRERYIMPYMRLREYNNNSNSVIELSDFSSIDTSEDTDDGEENDNNTGYEDDEDYINIRYEDTDGEANNNELEGSDNDNDFAYENADNDNDIAHEDADSDNNIAHEDANNDNIGHEDNDNENDNNMEHDALVTDNK